MGPTALCHIAYDSGGTAKKRKEQREQTDSQRVVSFLLGPKTSSSIPFSSSSLVAALNQLNYQQLFWNLSTESPRRIEPNLGYLAIDSKRKEQLRYFWHMKQVLKASRVQRVLNISKEKVIQTFNSCYIKRDYNEMCLFWDTYYISPPPTKKKPARISKNCPTSFEAQHLTRL